MPLTFGSLFAGIGGFDLGFERAGMECKWQVEIDPFCQKVLSKHWPDVRRHDDVRTFPPDGVWNVDVICGGFPCQDISAAGTGEGLDGSRSGLWTEFYRIICDIRPRYVAIENSAMLVNRGLRRILRDFAKIGFDAEWQVVQASDFALPHRRKRLFIIAYTDTINGPERVGAEQIWKGEVFTRDLRERLPIRIQAANQFIGMDDGISGTTYRLRGQAIGNAVVPQVAEWIGRRIVAAG